MTRKLRRWRAYAAIATGMVMLAGTAALAAAPARASTTGHAGASGPLVKPAPARPRPATPRTLKAEEAHYTNAGCNTASLKKNYAQCFAAVYTAIKNKIAASPNQPPAGALGPADIQSAYNLPSTGQGQTVGIVDAFGDSTAESDLAAFRSFYGLPPCTTANGCFRKVDQNGGTNYPPDNNSPNGGWALETSLDLDAVSAACPNCHILLVQGNDNSIANLGVAEDTAVSLGAKFVSNSYGIKGEDSSETSLDPYYNHPGVAVVAASGDSGGPVTSWPATSPDVTGAGGTTLAKDTSVPRGWTETAWSSGGSGCSLYEPKPSYQDNIKTQCPDDKAISDLSADADPATGLAVYDTNGESGWIQVGGTSLASPLITAMYALAGTPFANTYPVSYPYQDPNQSADLNDITQGSNGTCLSVLCHAGPGWDGPTGLGTPHGIAALSGGPEGTLAGKVTSTADGAPIAGATVAATGGYSATTDSAGDYTLPVPVGSYTLTAQAYGFKNKSVANVQVTQGQATTDNFALASVPSHTVSGTVTDGSGHGYPLYAKITISGYPGNAVYTNPYTGSYSVSLARGARYTLSVTPVYPGYNTATASVSVAASNVTKNVKVTVGQTTCSAPGYAFKLTGSTEGFTGWKGTAPQDGWTNVDNDGSGHVWKFRHIPAYLAPPGGDGQYAIAESAQNGPGNTQNTALVSPVLDLSRDTTPVINFDTYYQGALNQTADVDLSLDGGHTWTHVWKQTTNTVQGPVSIPIPQAAGQSSVRVRFHFASSNGWWWSLDNVFIGNKNCGPTPGGYVDGVVTDHNTGDPVNGAQVTSHANPAQVGVTAANPADPNLPNGFYWLFATPPGNTQFAASDGSYTPSTQMVDVAASGVVHQDWSLQAGQLAITPGSTFTTETLGAAKTSNLKFTDDGTQPIQVTLSEQNGGFTPMTGQADNQGAPLERIKGTFTPDARISHPAAGANAAAKARAAVKLLNPTPTDAPWASIANYPTPIMDNAVALDSSTGKVYSVGGTTGGTTSDSPTAASYVYDPSSQQWSSIASAPGPVQAARAGFIDGKLYVVGGWDASGNASTTTYIYDPSTGSWSQGANLPSPVSAAASAVLNGRLYVVGGCTSCTPGTSSTAVYRYDPGSNTWTQLANYPTEAAFAACAGIDGEVVCAGGINPDTGASLNSTYIYEPGSSTWSQGATMPYDDWGMAYAGDGNMLQIAGGVTDNSSALTNQAAEYDPGRNTWTALPNANNAEYRGGGACGIYKIGGSISKFDAQNFAEVLPGFDSCGAKQVPWLSESTNTFTLNPGQSQTVGVTVDSSAVSQPGTYSADLAISTNSPYHFTPVSLGLQANPPSSWSKITGTVTDSSTGSPIPGATVQICTMYNTQTGTCGPVTYSLKTDTNGNYQLWLNRGFNPLQLIAAMNGYQPVSKVARLTKGSTTTVNFALNRS
jgi:N-acetylneuraminic acid mutarotase